jgi:hypothetical protein
VPAATPVPLGGGTTGTDTSTTLPRTITRQVTRLNGNNLATVQVPVSYADSAPSSLRERHRLPVETFASANRTHCAPQSFDSVRSAMS